MKREHMLTSTRDLGARVSLPKRGGRPFGGSQVPRTLALGAAACLLIVPILLLSGCRGNDEQRLRAQPRTAPAEGAKRVPNLIGMTYGDARARFLQAGGELVRAKPKRSSEPPGTVIEQQPPPGERFIHVIELVIARPLGER